MAEGNAPSKDTPIVKGFRMRGHEMTRVETFTDAAFAFSVTLLVISIDAVPANFDQLVSAMKDIPAFGLSFLILMLFWYGHWGWSRRFGLNDLPSVWLSGLLVFIVLCYVYPLKFIFSLFMRSFSGGTLSPNASISSPGQLYDAFAIYGVGFSLMSAVILLLNLHAWRLRSTLQLNELEKFDTQYELRGWSIMLGVGLVSTLIALLAPPGIAALPGMVYMSLGILMPLNGILYGKRRGEIVALSRENSGSEERTHA